MSTNLLFPPENNVERGVDGISWLAAFSGNSLMFPVAILLLPLAIEPQRKAYTTDNEESFYRIPTNDILYDTGNQNGKRLNILNIACVIWPK
ncbi:hypothetical protein TNCV_3482681 [Trichonephila clavipes]|nr:hypothetical protein TNCV_3482681 [Trichonephila clavipes]